MTRNLLQLTVLSGLLFLYLAISLHNLTIVPPVYEDEPWQASTGWKLANHGVFGSDMFAGFYGMDERHYWFMPVHPLLLAATFRVAGLGLFQSRLEPVMMGLLTLVLTYALGRRLFDSTIGLLAVVLLLCVRLTGLTTHQVSGILLLDMVRIARYDMVVPVFGLASFYAYLSASRGESARTWAAGRGATSSYRYGLAGLLAGLSGLSHVYGVFWIISLGILALWDGVGWRSLTALALGFTVPWLPYVAYVLSDLPDWIGQTRGYAPRFDLLNSYWYWNNLLQEYHRYGPGLGPLGWHYLLRPGFWVALVVLPVSLIVLAVRALRRGDWAARALVVPALVFPTLFALLISSKLANYLVTVIPLGALTAAWGTVSLWRWAGDNDRRRWVRVALVTLLLAVIAEGVTRIATLEAAAATTTPYANFITRVRAYIPAGSRVLGLHTFWFGLQDLDYRAWGVPLLHADGSYGLPPLPLDQTLDSITPDVILIDVRLRTYFDNAPAADLRPGIIRQWMERRGYARVTVIEDKTYGRMEVYRRQ